jgi:hypothetical protein
VPPREVIVVDDAYPFEAREALARVAMDVPLRYMRFSFRARPMASYSLNYADAWACGGDSCALGSRIWY